MGRPIWEKDPGLPERVVDRLLNHLKRHALWDSLLIFFPPLVVFSYLNIFLYSSAWINQETLIFASGTVLGITLLLGILRHRSMAPSVRLAARLIDARVEGKDRFITLATMDPSFCPSFLLAHLRHEAAGLLHRIDLKKDFPYRVKRSFFTSFIGALAAILLFHLFLQLGPFFTPQAPSVKELALLAQRSSQVPRLSELARGLEALAVRMQEQTLSREEKRSLIQDVLKRVENQLAAEQQRGEASNDLLSQAADLLRGLERGLKKGREQGGGGLKTNLPEEREGEGKESAKGSGGKGQGEFNATEGRELQGEKFALKEKEEGKGEGGKDQGRGDRTGRDREKSKEIEGMAKGGQEGKGGKSQGEDIPRGATPERFMQPGEQGKEGLKGARFVTVQLPEEEEQGSSGEGGGKRRGLRPKVPVSNVPLRRPDFPDASPEKQPLPLEYRGLIR